MNDSRLLYLKTNSFIRYLPFLSDFVNKYDVVCLSNCYLGWIRGKCHGLDHIGFFPILQRIKRNCNDGYLRYGLFLWIMTSWIRAKIHLEYLNEMICWSLTLGSAGFVVNLSLFSPCSSYSITTLSIVHTANFALFGAQAIQVTLAAPSYRKETTQLLFSKQSLGLAEIEIIFILLICTLISGRMHKHPSVAKLSSVIVPTDNGLLASVAK